MEDVIEGRLLSEVLEVSVSLRSEAFSWSLVDEAFSSPLMGCVSAKFTLLGAAKEFCFLLWKDAERVLFRSKGFGFIEEGVED